MGLNHLWRIGRARAGIREIEDHLLAFDRVFEDLQRHGRVGPALDARYRRLRDWFMHDYDRRRRLYEDVVRHGALRLGDHDPILTLFSPTNLDGIIGVLEQTIQARGDARHLLTRAMAELMGAESNEREASARGALGMAIGAPLRLVTATAGFVDRHARLVAGLGLLVVALILWPDQRQYLIGLAIVALLAERIYVASRPS